MDITEAVKTLTLLTLIAAGQTVALEQVFDTQLYQKWLGFGENGRGSRLLPTVELRPWISSAVGLFIAFHWEIQFPGKALPGAGGPDDLVVGCVMAGLIIGGGTKAIKKLLKDVKDTSQEVKSSLVQ